MREFLHSIYDFTQPNSLNGSKTRLDFNMQIAVRINFSLFSLKELKRKLSPARV